MQRREFIQFSLLSIAAACSAGALAGNGSSLPDLRFLSSVDDAIEGHFIVAANSAGQQLFRIPVVERCHSGCLHPRGNQAVIISRRPGLNLYVINMLEGTLEAKVEAGEGFHFYGHGVFSEDGSRFYATANHYSSGAGHIRVYAADEGYRHLHDFPVGGMDPHELRLHPDGERLVVAMGGIKTHPDYGRIKLNVETMQPALVMMDRESGEVLQRCTPSHHQLSCHHLDISRDGIVIAGYQFEGPKWEAPPLIARLDTDSGEFSEIALTEQEQAKLSNYTASVAINSRYGVAAITAPRGNCVMLLDYRSGQPMGLVSVPDPGGVLAEPDGNFVVSSGHGGLYRIQTTGAKPELISRHALRWDNHLTRA
ncbi:hypothetical protein SAMN05216198_1644 [Halopseudomonas litoralis]|uniref:DUF1513 domain-containing protein n=1 Tax=Halopseudomonas litoralis TaxID=797277 RepID=A0A1H1R554_9GAMM|nr:DUF1513 domain-containing protein [Halopseudomonas litoralis]SDS30059.1 hypothetical protein SAMN05216198_1644 [Halopseudomonas litoralis]